MAAGLISAARLSDILMNGHPAEGEIPADSDVVELELGSRRETGCL
jgi:hypothetical protein